LGYGVERMETDIIGSNQLGDLFINGTLTVRRNAVMKDKLTVENGAVLKDKLSVEKETMLMDKLSVGNNAIINGNLTVEKNTTLKSVLEFELGQDSDSDIARRFYTDSPIDFRIGEVVYFDRKGHLRTEVEQANPRVAGVVSGKPRILLPGVETRSDLRSCLLVTSGVAPCRVICGSDERIEVGDLLTSAGPIQPGGAMKAKEIDLGNNVKIYKPGSIIGKALESFDASAAALKTIKILVMRS
jgi:hypothetical protein